MKAKLGETFAMVKGVLAVAFEDYKRNLAKENAVDKALDIIGAIGGLVFMIYGIVGITTYLINLF